MRRKVESFHMYLMEILLNIHNILYTVLVFCHHDYDDDEHFTVTIFQPRFLLKVKCFNLLLSNMLF